MKFKPSVLNASPILEVPAYFPTLSSARYKRKIVSFLTTVAGLNTSFSSHFTISFLTGQRKIVVESGCSTGFTSSTLIKGSNVQSSFDGRVESFAASCSEGACLSGCPHPANIRIVSIKIVVFKYAISNKKYAIVISRCTRKEDQYVYQRSFQTLVL